MLTHYTVAQIGLFFIFIKLFINSDHIATLFYATAEDRLEDICLYFQV